MTHHILREEELKSRCLYCNSKIELKKWESQFENFFHYKTAVCEKCHHENRIKMKFDGSGEDSWTDGLETKIMKK
jgi:hypothetical protein